MTTSNSTKNRELRKSRSKGGAFVRPLPATLPPVAPATSPEVAPTSKYVELVITETGDYTFDPSVMSDAAVDDMSKQLSLKDAVHFGATRTLDQRRASLAIHLTNVNRRLRAAQAKANPKAKAATKVAAKPASEPVVVTELVVVDKPAAKVQPVSNKTVELTPNQVKVKAMLAAEQVRRAERVAAQAAKKAPAKAKKADADDATGLDPKIVSRVAAVIVPAPQRTFRQSGVRRTEASAPKSTCAYVDGVDFSGAEVDEAKQKALDAKIGRANVQSGPGAGGVPVPQMKKHEGSRKGKSQK